MAEAKKVRQNTFKCLNDQFLTPELRISNLQLFEFIGAKTDFIGKQQKYCNIQKCSGAYFLLQSFLTFISNSFKLQNKCTHLNTAPRN